MTSETEKLALDVISNGVTPVTHFTVASTVIMSLINADISGTIFKVIQIVNLFDKLRLLNIDLSGTLGKFLDIISSLFSTNFFGKDDYQQSTNPSKNKFYDTKTSAISYRNKIDKYVLLTLAMLIDMAVYLFNFLKPLKPHTFTSLKKDKQYLLNLEKRLRVQDKLHKLVLAILLMTSIDIFFYGGHQLIHQRLDTMLNSIEYSASFVWNCLLLNYFSLKMSIFFQSMYNLNITLPVNNKPSNKINNKSHKNSMAARTPTTTTGNILNSNIRRKVSIRNNIVKTSKLKKDKALRGDSILGKSSKSYVRRRLGRKGTKTNPLSPVKSSFLKMNKI